MCGMQGTCSSAVQRTSTQNGVVGENPNSNNTICSLERAPRSLTLALGAVSEVSLEEQAARGGGQAPLVEGPCVWGVVRPFRWAEYGKQRGCVEGSVGLVEEWTVSLLKGKQVGTPTPHPQHHVTGPEDPRRAGWAELQ